MSEFGGLWKHLNTPGKATRVSYGRNPNGTIQLSKKTKNTEAAAGGPQVTDAIILPRIIFLKMSTFKPLNILSFSATRGSFVGWRKEITLGFVREWDGRKDRGEVF